jgi:hypothetical protein
LVSPFATPAEPAPPPLGSHQTLAQRAIVVFAVLIVVGCFGWLVWPTPYRFDTLRSGGSSVPVRINRISGEAARLSVVGWVSMQSSPAASRQAVQLTPSELAKLTGTAAIAEYGWIEANIYNGNDFGLGNLVLSVTVTNSDGTTVLTRDYRMSSRGGDSLESSKFIVDPGYRMTPGQKFSWLIKSAERK